MIFEVFGFGFDQRYPHQLRLRRRGEEFVFTYRKYFSLSQSFDQPIDAGSQQRAGRDGDHP